MVCSAILQPETKGELSTADPFLIQNFDIVHHIFLHYFFGQILY